MFQLGTLEKLDSIEMKSRFKMQLSFSYIFTPEYVIAKTVGLIASLWEKLSEFSLAANLYHKLLSCNNDIVISMSKGEHWWTRLIIITEKYLKDK